MPYRKITVLNHDIIEVKTYDRLNTTGGGDFSEIVKGIGFFKDVNYNERQRVRKINVRQLVTCNFSEHSKFITLTFKANEIDVKQANSQFKKFIKRLKYWNDKQPFKYLAVVEFQKRGAVHYHMIADLEFIPASELQSLWGQGFIKINDISHVDNVGAYVVKYMNKDTDDARLQGLKAYNCSRGLELPVELKSWAFEDRQAVEDFSQSLQKEMPVYSSQYTSENTGVILYQQYNFKRQATKCQDVSKCK
jgi:hypothetical protein